MTSTEIVDTPWGPSTSIERVAPGIAFVSTASHGGFMLSPDRQAAMPASLKPFTGDRRFWEEDCDAALVAARFADDMGIAPERAEKARLFIAGHFGLTTLAAINRARTAA